jgi:hypothetical protein
MEASRFEDLSAERIKAAFQADRRELTEEQVLAIRDFLIDIGGVDNALAAIELLSQLEQAA